MLALPAFATSSIAVLYPEVSPPYRAIFAEIVDGVREGLGTSSLQINVLTEPVVTSELRAWLLEVSPSAVITLGRVATLGYESSDVRLPQIIGALDVSPDARPQASGISLAIEPSLLFDTLDDIASSVERVFVVLHPQRDRWLRGMAERAAQAAGLELVVREAQDPSRAARQTWQIINEADPSRDALWLSSDSASLNSEAVLPLIIERSWHKRLIVFSSQLEHAQRGVLFALYPDHLALGQDLAELANQLVANPSQPPRIHPLRSVKRALNRRVAAHLRLLLTRELEQRFELVLEPR